MTWGEADNRKKKAMGGKPSLNSKPPEVPRCPAEHPAWNLYFKRVGQETIMCCRACEQDG